VSSWQPVVDLKHVPRLQKLKERAHIGHLIGYDASNIFRIWIPSQRMIIRTRDVIFDESSKYDPHDIDLLQVLSEPMIETTFEPNQSINLSQIKELDSESENEYTGDTDDDISQAKQAEGQVKAKEIGQSATPEHAEYLLTPSPSLSNRSTPFPTSSGSEAHPPTRESTQEMGDTIVLQPRQPRQPI
jgi:hypothetical protein